MNERYVTLIGTEQVQNAAHTMSSAAEQMSRAASSIHETMWRHQQFMDEWLLRFERAINPESTS